MLKKPVQILPNHVKFFCAFLYLCNIIIDCKFIKGGERIHYSHNKHKQDFGLV